MDVRCTRCGTEYEFDDALIAERGTSVRCTQCGFQFKVFPPQLSTVGPDEWVVLTSLGRRVVYRSLRELQGGISKSEVAREDLLARGSKPPRPLGSIAELDPLFTTKSAPERQPSTLTGVAPPAQGAVKSAPPPGGSLGRAGHDTFSGVAPPANSPAAEAPMLAPAPAGQAAARPAPPMRVGGSSTVLGIGTGTESTVATATATATAAPKPVAAAESSPPETRSFESLQPRGSVKSAGESEPPTNRPPPPAPEHLTPEPKLAVVAPLPRMATELGVAPAPGAVPEGHTVPLPSVEAEPSVPAEPSLVKPPVPRRTEAKPVEPRATVAALRAEDEHAEGESAVEQKAVAKVLLTTKAVAVRSGATATAAAAASDPPTARWTGQVLEVAKHDAPAADPATQPSEPALAVSVATLASSPSMPATTRSGELKAPEKTPDKKSSDQKIPRVEPSQAPASDSHKRVVDVGALPRVRDDATTSPPTRPRDKGVQAIGASVQPKPAEAAKTLASGGLAPKPLFTTGRVTVAVLLIGLGLFAGMKIVGSQLEPTKVPMAGPAPSAALPSAQPAVLAVAAAPVLESLRIGDPDGAQQVLAGVFASGNNELKYRNLHAQALAQSADLVWWKVQLIGKASGGAYNQAKQQLTERLERVKTSLAAVGPEAQWVEEVQAASLDMRRMRGDKSTPTDPTLLERLKQPVTAELKYTQLMLEWVRTGTPDEKILDGLRRLRAVPVDVGPRATALLVALVQTNHFEDAQAELSRLSSQARPHALYDEMRAYVTKAELASAETAAGNKLDAGTADRTEPGENDPDLLEGDFRLRLTRASECLSRNELTKAQKLLRSVLAQRPNDTEAITALGDVLRRRGDLTQSRDLYDKALGLNANYLPAMSGAADIRWRSGDRAGAASLYRRIVERVGETPGYGQVATARLREVDSSGKPSAESANDSSPARDGKPNTPKGDVPTAPKGAQ